MKCPYCNEETEKGYIQSKDGVVWTAKKHIVPILGKMFDPEPIDITDSRSFAATAYRCEKCETVIIPYGKNGESNG